MCDKRPTYLTHSSGIGSGKAVTLCLSGRIIAL